MAEMLQAQLEKLKVAAASAPGQNLESLNIPRVEKMHLHIAPRALALDFDGTVVESEALHRATFFCAVSSLLNQPLRCPELESDKTKAAKDPAAQTWQPFERGFGKPEWGTCLAMAEELRAVLGQEEFDKRFSHTGTAETPIERAARLLLKARMETFHYFVDHSTLAIVPDEQGLKRDQLVFTPQLYDAKSGLTEEQWKLRDETLSRIQVRLCPDLRPFLDAVTEQEVTIGSREQRPYVGVCTSSSREFVRTLIDKFELGNYFRRPDRPEEYFEVYCNDIPEGYHKPYHLPWRTLLEQFNESAQVVEGVSPTSRRAFITRRDVLALENTAGGFLSSMLAGFHTIGCASIDVSDGLADQKFKKEKARIDTGALFGKADRSELRALKGVKDLLADKLSSVQTSPRELREIEQELVLVRQQIKGLFERLKAFSAARRLRKLFAADDKQQEPATGIVESWGKVGVTQ